MTPPAGPCAKSAAREELEHFKAFLSQCKSVSGAAMGLAALLPAAGGMFPELIPPWPRGVQLVGFSVAIVGVLLAFLLARTSTSVGLRKASITCLVVGAICLLVYTLLLSSWVVRLDEDLYEVTGFALTDEAEAAVSSGVAKSGTARDLFAVFGYESGDRIWRLRGIAKWLIALSFLATFGLGSSGFALLVVRNLAEDGSGAGKRGRAGEQCQG